MKNSKFEFSFWKSSIKNCFVLMFSDHMYLIVFHLGHRERGQSSFSNRKKSDDD